LYSLSIASPSGSGDQKIRLVRIILINNLFIAPLRGKVTQNVQQATSPIRLKAQVFTGDGDIRIVITACFRLPGICHVQIRTSRLDVRLKWPWHALCLTSADGHAGLFLDKGTPLGHAHTSHQAWVSEETRIYVDAIENRQTLKGVGSARFNTRFHDMHA
jgi:hypothetical protein